MKIANFQISKFPRIKRNLNKRGISEMVGYVILISIGVIMGLLVYQWLKTYVPNEAVECPDTVSVSVENLACDVEQNQISFDLKNNGLFRIDGYYIYATTLATQKVATENLATIKDPNIDHIDFGNELNPGDIITAETFTLTKDNQPLYIYSVEITPMRIQKNAKEVDTFVQCSDAKVTEKIQQCP